MNNQRYNSFNQIHKGLRALLFDTSLKLQKADLSNPDSAAKAMQQVTEVLLLFEGHANGEDTYFNEPIEALEPTVGDLFMKEHEEDHRLGDLLSKLSKSWYSAESNEQRLSIGKELLYAFYEFTAFNLYHMNKEEHQLNEALWKHYSDQQIKQAEQELVRNVSPEKMPLYMRWMIRGINKKELVHWVREVKQFAPPQAYSLLERVAKEELTKDQFDSIWSQAGIATLAVL